MGEDEVEPGEMVVSQRLGRVLTAGSATVPGRTGVAVGRPPRPQEEERPPATSGGARLQSVGERLPLGICGEK